MNASRPGYGSFLFLIFILVGPSHHVRAETTAANLSLASSGNAHLAKSTETPRNRLFFLGFWDDLIYLSSEPDLYLVVGAIGGSPKLFPRMFENESPEITELWGHSTFADNLFEVGEIVGDGALPVLASATSWSIGKFSGSASLREFGSDLFRSQVMNGVITAVLKVGIHRTRPDGTSYSYPSGHTSSAFVTAGTVYAHFGKVWGIPAFLLAGYVGLSRLQEGRHFLSDVVAGGILGSYVSLKLAGTVWDRGSVSVTPIAGGGSVGLSLSLKF